MESSFSGVADYVDDVMSHLKELEFTRLSVR